MFVDTQKKDHADLIYQSISISLLSELQVSTNNNLWNNPGNHGDRILYVHFDLCLLGTTSRVFKLHLYSYAAIIRDHLNPLQNKRLAFQFAFNGERRASAAAPLFGRTTWIYSFCASSTLQQIIVCHLSLYVILLAMEASICSKHNFPWDFSTSHNRRSERWQQIETAFTAPESTGLIPVVFIMRY